MIISSGSYSSKPYTINLNRVEKGDVLNKGKLLSLRSFKTSETLRDILLKKPPIQYKIKIKIEKVKTGSKILSNVFGNKYRMLYNNHNLIFYIYFTNNKPTGGSIFIPISKNTLFLKIYFPGHNISENLKEHLWCATVNDIIQKFIYDYIDLGSIDYPPLLINKKKWSLKEYPIIFKPPYIKPLIRLTPFENKFLPQFHIMNKGQIKIMNNYFGEKYTILPRAIYCIKLILEHLKIKKQENVAIFKTFENEYISRCVSEIIENKCKISREINPLTKAVMVIHEFGYPCTKTLKIKKLCQRSNIPLIENCAWTYGTLINGKVRVGSVGDYSIYSLPKILPMQYGGIITGLSSSNVTVENYNEFRDDYKNNIILSRLGKELIKIEKYNLQKVQNWNYLAKMFLRDGLSSLIPLEKGVFPSALIIKMDQYEKIFKRYSAFGIETGRYYHEKALFLPIHQLLDENALNYIYAVFKGFQRQGL